MRLPPPLLAAAIGPLLTLPLAVPAAAADSANLAAVSANAAAPAAGNSDAATSAAGNSDAVTSTAGLSDAAITGADSSNAATSAVGSASKNTSAAGSRAVSGERASARTSISLVTGDKVTLDGQRVGIEPAAGREHTGFAISTYGGRRYVVPEDAQPLIASGRLDKELFDVTALQAYGYTTATPVVTESTTRRFAAARPKTGTPLGQLVAGHAKVWLDGKKQIAADVNVTQIGAPTAWQAGFTGTGVKVAILDTGIDETHPDLAGQVLAEQNFSAQPSIDDTVGHGTHVASIIAGSGANLGGKYTGVAPGAKLMIGKVCETTYCTDSAILAGMQWAVDQGADVVNMSLGSPSDTPGVDPIEEAVNTLSATSDTLFVVAAGNSGPGATTLGSPGSADAALTVGAVDADDRIAPFSSRGPRIGDGALKPDITAPGVGIVAAKAADGYLGDPAPDPGYVSMSGTSMATPHVAGAAALLKQEHPDWDGVRLKNTLMGAATPTAGLSVFAQGAGRVDLTRAVTQVVSADPPSVSFGLETWPHDDDRPIDRTLTYSNPGASPVTLALSVEGGGPFAVSPATLTVPAGGQATAVVVADTRGLTTYGTFEASVVASGDGNQVRTPMAVSTEGETYALNLTTLDSTGTPHAASLTVYRLDEAGTVLDAYTGDDGTGTLRLPKGTYGVTGTITTSTEVTLAIDADIELGQNRDVTLDARRAEPIDVSIPGDPAATETNGSLELDAHGDVTGAGLDYQYVAFGGFSNSGRTFRVARLGGTVTGYLHEDWRSGTDTLYTLGWTLPSGFTHAVTPAGVELRDTALPAFPDGGHTYLEAWFSPLTEAQAYGFAAAIDISGTRVLHLYASPGTDGGKWSYSYLHYDQGFTETQAAWTPYAQFRAGKVTRTAAMTPVLGPTATPVGDGGDWARTGDKLVPGYSALFGDAAGNRGWARTSTSTTSLTNVDTGAAIPLDGSTYTYPLPATPTRLRLAFTGIRADTAASSSRVDLTWEFWSARGDTSLPVTAVRFVPRLDADGSAPAGRPFAVPLQIQRAPGAAPIRRVTAQVSYDDGTTWKPAPTVGGALRLNHPAGPGYVSLRAQATDRAGNTVNITILRAYALS